MVQKKKVGKERTDKYYHLAKDHGYRARSAFKLVQLANQHDFLSNAKICIDLCGAPGGWSQVAAKYMAKGSKIICVDICPMKPIPGVTAIQCDITLPKCRQLLNKEMLGRNADVVLNDGAPNVGANWVKDAFVQNELTLHALKLATDHLRPGGVFVTKVFRSADYTSLLWVFNQLFHKVEATKPQASRQVSAEIFVTCVGFKKDAIDPKLLDPKHVFMDTATQDDIEKKPGSQSRASLNDLIKFGQKRRRGGYEEGDEFRTCPLIDFVKNSSPDSCLTSHHKFTMDDEESKALPNITEDLKSYMSDLKVLGKRELMTLLKWRLKIVRAFVKGKKEEKEAFEEAKKAALTPEQLKDIEEEKIDADLRAKITKIEREQKRDLKKAREIKQKFEWRKKMSLGMQYSGNVTEMDLFHADASTKEKLLDGGDYIDSDIEREMKAAAREKAEEDGSADKEDDKDGDESDLDSEAERIVEMEVEQVLAKQSDADQQSKNSEARELKKKKETRRAKAHKAWGDEIERDGGSEDIYCSCTKNTRNTS